MTRVYTPYDVITRVKNIWNMRSNNEVHTGLLSRVTR